jgi:hypothetical protein
MSSKKLDMKGAFGGLSLAPEPTAPAPAVEEPETIAAPVAAAPREASKKAPARTPAPKPATAPRAAAAPAPGAGAKWTELERKECRFRDDQLLDLTALARRLQRAKAQGSGERITDNTLIRVAVDLLLENHQDKLAGATEEELRKSVGL